MIIGIGIDTVAIERFATWHKKDTAELKRIFSDGEIVYCTSNPILSAQRFATRFAVREALFKAISSAFPEHTIPFLTLCPAVTITQQKNGAPKCTVSLNTIMPNIDQNLDAVAILVSLTHTGSIATAFVVLDRNMAS